MNWSPLQRETLAAMGLSPYRLASASPRDESASKVVPSVAPVERNVSAPIDPRRPAAAARDGDPPPALVAALLRAAGRGPDAADRDAVLRICPPPHALRGDARAKRALWPTLRAMRKR